MQCEQQQVKYTFTPLKILVDYKYIWIVKNDKGISIDALKCEECGKVFSSEAAIKRHKRNHINSGIYLFGLSLWNKHNFILK